MDAWIPISIHAPRKGERLGFILQRHKVSKISIHAPRKGERRLYAGDGSKRFQFQSTLPARGSDLSPRPSTLAFGGFQSTLPARGSDIAMAGDIIKMPISIHAPRKGERLCSTGTPSSAIPFQSTLPARGSDTDYWRGGLTWVGISIHAPRKGERRRKRGGKNANWYFNPRSPQGGATCIGTLLAPIIAYFNPRSPQGGATDRLLGAPVYMSISIHAPRKGERPDRKPRSRARRVFQSTLPARGSDGFDGGTSKRGHFNPRSPQGGATLKSFFLRRGLCISIHAPRKGERPLQKAIHHYTSLFQSTLPARGSDSGRRIRLGGAGHFNPRSPQGGATPWGWQLSGNFPYFNPRSPQGGATRAPARGAAALANFNPRSPQGGATMVGKSQRKKSKFQSTLPARGSDYSNGGRHHKNADFNPRSPQGGATYLNAIFFF